MMPQILIPPQPTKVIEALAPRPLLPPHLHAVATLPAARPAETTLRPEPAKSPVPTPKYPQVSAYALT